MELFGENGLGRSLDREALRLWKTIHEGTCQIQFAHHPLFFSLMCFHPLEDIIQCLYLRAGCVDLY